MVHIGDPKDVADQYLELNFGRDPQAVTAEGGRVGDGDAQVTKVWAEDEHGQDVPAVAPGHEVTLRVLVEFRVDVEDPQASVYIHNEDHQVVLSSRQFMQHERTGSFRAGERGAVLVHVRQRARTRPLQPGDQPCASRAGPRRDRSL